LRPKDVASQFECRAFRRQARDEGICVLGEVKLGSAERPRPWFPQCCTAGREFEVHYIWVAPGPSYNLREGPKCAGSWIETWRAGRCFRATSTHRDTSIPETVVVTTCRLGGAVANTPPSNPAPERTGDEPAPHGRTPAAAGRSNARSLAGSTMTYRRVSRRESP